MTGPQGSLQLVAQHRPTCLDSERLAGVDHRAVGRRPTQTDQLLPEGNELLVPQSLGFGVVGNLKCRHPASSLVQVSTYQPCAENERCTRRPARIAPQGQVLYA